MSDPTDAERIDAMRNRLDQVADEIEEARRDAEKVLPQKPKESFVEAGDDTSGETDAAIASP